MIKKTSIFSVLGSILASLGFVTCCGTPLVASLLSIFGLGASQLAIFSKYQEVFIFISLLSIIIGFYQIYFVRKNSNCCSATKNIGDSKKSKISLILLWVSTLIIVFVIILSYQKNNKSSNCCKVNETEIKTPCCNHQQ